MKISTTANSKLSSEPRNINQTTFDYPIVLKYVHGYLTASIPDLGLDLKAPILKNFNEIEDSKIKENTVQAINHLVCNLLIDANSHLRTKKWIPEASQVASPIKKTLKKPEKDYSLPEFCKKVSEYIRVSENTLRRQISRGEIICITTHGGHRRIPESEFEKYIKNLQGNKK